jgi:selT/selW/selH-like putative selenoprotein
LRIDCHADVTIREGARGAFEVFADGRLVHSKLETGLIPRAEAILESIHLS